MSARSRWGVLLAAAGVACEAPPSGGTPPVASADAASPNATILPAPLATEAPDLDAGTDAATPTIVLDDAGRPVLVDAGAPAPEAIRPDAPLAAEASQVRELVGVSLEAQFRWRDVPGAPKAPEVGLDGIQKAQRLTSLALEVDVTETGRVRMAFTSRALPLPAGSEIRARADRYGAIVLWPDGLLYRVVAPGALRPLFGERRVDVTPLAPATPVAQGEGKRLGVAVRKVEVGAALGSVKLEVGKVPEAGEGGVVLCRLLVELVGVDPKVAVCQSGELPLLATYAWKDGGGVALEVTSMTKRADLAQNALLVPPPGAAYAPAGLPSAPAGIFLTREELAAFRTAALPPPPPAAEAAPGAPGEGFVAVNRSDLLGYVLVDGVPVVAVPPFAERYVIGTARGRYVVQWRSFLGDRISPPATVDLPARLVHGEVPDAGAGGDGG